MQPFFNVDPIAEANPVSRAVVRITMEFEALGVGEGNAQVLATGSGIVYHHCDGENDRAGRYFLVTAWHNLSGKDPETMKPKNSSCGLPNWVRIEGYYFSHRTRLRDGDNQPGGTTNAMYWTSWKPLRRPGAHFQSWSEDEATKQTAQHDIAVLPLQIGMCECRFGLPLIAAGENLFVTDQVHVVGFPLGLSNQVTKDVPLPVWKVGHVANDPGPDFNGVPRFLIDATTLPGMSGAPVITQRQDALGRRHFQFLGIYVGRYAIPRPKPDGTECYGNEPRIESSALGWVVKPEVIKEIIDGGGSNNVRF